MERDRRTAIATFYFDAPFEPGVAVKPSSDVVNHVRARRLDDGASLRLTDGRGRLAAATLRMHARRDVEFVVSSVDRIARPPMIHLCAPIADRDRMLWLAEKSTELEVASWRGVAFRRSASVIPRGEGAGFAAKARARMISALEQSAGAWLPTTLDEAGVAWLASEAGGTRVVMDMHAKPLLSALDGKQLDPVTLLVGPEGGIEDDELTLLERAGWIRARLGGATLRFETAAMSAIAVVRAAQISREA